MLCSSILLLNLLQPTISHATSRKMSASGRCAQCSEQLQQHRQNQRRHHHHWVSPPSRAPLICDSNAIILFASMSLFLSSVMCQSMTDNLSLSSSPMTPLSPALTLPTPDLNSMLSPKNLGEYNRLIDCVAKIKGQFTRCNEEAQRKGEAVLKWVDEKSEMGTLLKCCGIWLVRDCWVRAAQQECTDDQVTQLRNMPTKMIPAIQSLCAKYQPGSSSCYTPHLILGAVALGALLLLLIIVVVIVMVVRHFRRRRQESTGLKLPEEIGPLSEGRDRGRNKRSEKVKLTAKSGGESNSGIININNNNNNLEFIDSEKVN